MREISCHTPNQGISVGDLGVCRRAGEGYEGLSGSEGLSVNFGWGLGGERGGTSREHGSHPDEA